jgi:hypothetical protein
MIANLGPFGQRSPFNIVITRLGTGLCNPWVIAQLNNDDKLMVT